MGRDWVVGSGVDVLAGERVDVACDVEGTVVVVVVVDVLGTVVGASVVWTVVGTVVGAEVTTIVVKGVVGLGRYLGVLGTREVLGARVVLGTLIVVGIVPTRSIVLLLLPSAVDMETSCFDGTGVTGFSGTVPFPVLAITDLPTSIIS